MGALKARHCFPATQAVAGRSSAGASRSHRGRLEGPLDGVIVADLSRVLAGPYCSMLLADLGATVIKVESPAGDDTRTWMPPENDGVATYYQSINRNKRSVVLDFRDADDVVLAQELLRRADIAIENFRPGSLAKFGLDFPHAAQLNERLIYLSITGFGTAEGAWLPGYDLVVQAVSGLMSLTGEPDGPAYRSGVAVFDVMTGLHGTIGVLAALRQRAETGRGQHVEVNLLSSALSGLVNQSAAFTAGGVVPHRMGNAHPSVYPYQPMPTKDRDVIITAANDRQFRSLCEVLGIAEVADDERFRLNADRTANRAELHPILVERLAQWTADDLFFALNKAGVPCGPINSIGEGIELAERLGLEPRVTVGEDGSSVDLVRNPIRLSDYDDRLPPCTAAARRAQRRDPRVADGCRAVNEPMTFRTGLGDSDADHIRLLGHDLAGELIGQITFGELAYWLITKRRPTEQQRTMFEAVLVALADHGFTPTAIAARVTLLSAPESVQGALAAGLLGGGSRFLGVTEDTAVYLDGCIAALDALPVDEAGWDAVAADAVAATKAAGRFVPGLGHPVHKLGDPRTPVLFALARETTATGRTSNCSRRSAGPTPASSARPCR